MPFGNAVASLLLIIFSLNVRLGEAQSQEDSFCSECGTATIDTSYQIDSSVLGNMKNMQQLPGNANRVIINEDHAQVVELMVGSPPQRLTCLLDSGSADLWIPSKRCRHCQNSGQFDADISQTFEGTRRPVRISYGSGTVVGFSVRDSVRIGSLQIPKQNFIIVEDAALPWRQWDGICGLGWKGLAQVGPTVYESMQQQGLPALVSIVPASSSSNRARLVLGEMPPQTSMQPNTLKWVSAKRPGWSSQRGFWVVSGGVQIHAAQPVPATFLVDTGTNQVLLVPYQFYQAFLRSLIPDQFDHVCGHDPRAGVFCSCSILEARLKPLQIHLGGHSFALPVSKMFRRTQSMQGREVCLLTIQPKARGSQMWMLGGVFLEHFVTVFDFDHGRLGFAEPSVGDVSYGGLFEVKEEVENKSATLHRFFGIVAAIACASFASGTLVFRSCRSQRYPQASLLAPMSDLPEEQSPLESNHFDSEVLLAA